MTPFQSETAKRFLRDRVTKPCACCGNTPSWALVGLVQRKADTLEGLKTIPLVLVACTNCFAVTEHVAKAMGLDV